MELTMHTIHAYEYGSKLEQGPMIEASPPEFLQEITNRKSRKFPRKSEFLLTGTEVLSVHLL